MKKNPSLVVSVISCILVVVCLIQISGLKSEINSLRSTVNNMSSQTSNSISNIYGTVHDMLEEQTNQLTSSDWQYGEIDVEAKSAEVICTIVPKVYTPDVTKASLLYNGQEIPMTYENGQYCATVSLPLFDESCIEQVLLDDEGSVRTQTLDWYISPRYEALLSSYASFSGHTTGTPADGEVKIQKNGTIHINVERKGEFQVQSIELVEMLDGEEIGRTPVDMSPEGQKEYAEAAADRGDAIPEGMASLETESANVTYEGMVDFIYELDKEYSISYGSMLVFYVDVVDGNGLRYRSFVDCAVYTADGKPDDEREEQLRLYEHSEPMYIFDEDGTLVYEVDKERFY